MKKFIKQLTDDLKKSKIRIEKVYQCTGTVGRQFISMDYIHRTPYDKDLSNLYAVIESTLLKRGISPTNNIVVKLTTKTKKNDYLGIGNTPIYVGKCDGIISMGYAIKTESSLSSYIKNIKTKKTNLPKTALTGNPNTMSDKDIALDLFKARRELLKWELYDYIKQYISGKLNTELIWYDRMDKVFKSLIKYPAGNDKRYIRIPLANYVGLEIWSDNQIIDLDKVDKLLSRISWEERLKAL